MHGIRIHHLIIGLFILISFLTLIASEVGIGTSEGSYGINVKPTKHQEFITLFMCGDVMLGRGIDQILTHPSNPEIHESYIKDARGYLKLAERLNGPIPHPVDDNYIWGYALEEFDRIDPDLKIINLETSITKSDDYWINKGINYRMHPKNIGSITSVKIDFCSLANNHLLDWGYSGLAETTETLKKTGIQYSGAGKALSEAERPAIMEIEGKGRVIVFSYGLRSSGIPLAWAASPENPGVNFLTKLSDDEVEQIKQHIARVEKPKDVVVFSIHWGGNWGYQIPEEHITFAHQLINQAGVDVIHGHSSHHFKGIEVYKNKLIIYGCGDFINDYEGIRGHESFRDDLVLMYFARLDPMSGQLVELQLTPAQIKKFQLNKAEKTDVIWMKDVLNREGRKLNTSVELNKDLSMTLCWN